MSFEHLTLARAQHRHVGFVAAADLACQAGGEVGPDDVAALCAAPARRSPAHFWSIPSGGTRRHPPAAPVHDRRLVVRRYQQHPGRQLVALDRGRDLRAVHAGHPVVEQRHLRRWVLIGLERATPSSASATTSIEPLDMSARTTPSRNSGWSSPTTTRTFSLVMTRDRLHSGACTSPDWGTSGSSALTSIRPTDIGGSPKDSCCNAGTRRPTTEKSTHTGGFT